ncbi:MAG: polysaccharide deacetylase family protein [Actinobacteria bacterium]|nr:MAG: polysaccharide deacetylase family protein [Actinomycetota bacterium]
MAGGTVRRPTRRRLTPLVLCYHAVSDDWPHRLALPADLLLRQVDALRRLRRVHVTFDDAFRSIVDVIPALQERGLPVTIFVCTGFADAGGAPLLIPELASDDDRDVAELATLTWDELRTLASFGVEIASHTVTHARLPAIAGEDLSQELEASKRRLEEELGGPCDRLAYPYGRYDARVRAAARAAGYSEAFALRRLARDRFARPRVDLYRRHTPIRALGRAASSPFSRSR